MKNRLLIVGAGDLGQRICHYARLFGTYEPIGFVDDTMRVGESVLGLPVLGPIKTIGSLYGSKFDRLIIAIGYKHLRFRENLYRQLAPLFPFATLVSPQAYIDPTASIGAGSCIGPGCLIDCHAQVGENCFLAPASLIAHDAHVGSSCYLSLKATLLGHSSVGKCSFIGGGDNKRQPLCGEECILGMGSVLTKNQPARQVWCGNPARYLRAVSGESGEAGKV